MCKVLCLLALICQSVSNAVTWDVAVTFGDQIEFYNNGLKTNSESAKFHELTAMAYDPIRNVLYFVDKEDDSASIHSYNLVTKEFNRILTGASENSIDGIAFDPVSRILIWTDSTNKSIYWSSLVAKSDYNKNLLIKMVDEIPKAIAVDSCGEYIYWTNINVSKPSIKRARLDGSENETIIDTDIFMPVSIAIDERTQTLYWADDKEGIHYEIQSSDLDGKNRKTLHKGTDHQPKSLTVSNDSIYWIDWSFKSVWKLDKGQPNNTLKNIIKFSDNPFSIVANYEISEQIEGVSKCNPLKKLSLNVSALNETYSEKVDNDLYCLYGDKEHDRQSCKCRSGYSGLRCENNVCENYCLRGDCRIVSGQPVCSCKQEYTGSRCEVYICNNYCLNDAVCSVEEKKPTCKCSGEYEGERCEVMKILAPTPAPPLQSKQRTSEQNSISSSNNLQSKLTVDSKDEPLETSPEVKIEQKGAQNKTSSEDILPESTIDLETVQKTNCISEWDPLRDSIILVLAVLCGIMCVASALLIKKIMHLKRRPRIKKRIIVNKNVTPLTARPDQCEITIEDCCNMNICETPCFEPRPNFAKIGKEDKMNLIASMEHPDDLF